MPIQETDKIADSIAGSAGVDPNKWSEPTLRLIKAGNTLMEVRKADPGSVEHNRMMLALLEIIAGDPEALARLKALQR